jgi:hypothetical protein
MVTLIAVYNSEGLVGRCDARCYAASDERCRCICQGKNHRKGLQVAIDNTRDMCDRWLEHARAVDPSITKHMINYWSATDPLF